MTIKIQGTNSTAAPGITGGDTDTGVKFGTNEVTIVTNGTDRFKIGSDGAINTNMQCHGHIELDSTGSFTTPAVKLFADTGEIRVKSGGGINFDAYATSGNPSSNLLDDYEEGTWTPVIKSGTNTITQSGGDGNYTYTKIGRLVKLYFSMNGVTTAGTTGGDCTVTGLPFATTSTSNFRFISGDLMFYNTGMTLDAFPLYPHVSHNETIVSFYEKGGHAAGYNSAHVNTVGANTFWFWTLAYYTD